MWIDTGLGSYDSSTKEGWTFISIDSAYDSYNTVIHTLLISLDIPQRLRNQLNKKVRDYYEQLAIDSRQNTRPNIEKAEITIQKACQYAQACLIRDLRQLYPALTKVSALKEQIDEIMRVSPESIRVQLSPRGRDTGHNASFLDIRTPASAAKILGLLNSIDTLLDYTAHYTLLDEILQQKISEAM
jgi:hypothetical protein